jgi:hypothetical protein
MKKTIILIAVILALLAGGYFAIATNHKKALKQKDVEIDKLRISLIQIYKAKSQTDTVFINEPTFTDTFFIRNTIFKTDTILRYVYEKAPINTYQRNHSGDNYSFDYRIMVKGWMTSIKFENIFIKKEIEKIIVEVPFEVIEIKEVYTPKRHLYLSGSYYSDPVFNSWVAGFDYFGKKRLGFGMKYFFQSKGILAGIKIKIF